MTTRTRFLTARFMGALAIASLPIMLWLGWWYLAISVSLAATAALLAPGAHRVPAQSRTLAKLRAVERRLHPHPWRHRGW
jgi:hypothetical protein